MLAAHEIAAISVAISMLIFNRFRGDSAAVLRSVHCDLKSLRLHRGPETGAFGKPCFCPARKRGFLTKMAKMTNLHSNQ